MRTGEIGQICTPAEGRAPLDGVLWGADNGCFGKGYPGPAGWRAWLSRHAVHAERCLWATAPDVLGDAAATLDRSRPHLPAICALGYPAALVAQDGLEHLTVPWADFDVLFLGGTTAWKLGPAAARLAAEALGRSKRVHMGRVNSQRRWTYAEHLGCHTVDGTLLAFGPDTNLPRLLSWTRQSTLSRADR
ncbi:hypothetical protein [Actinocrispum wychmicini]|nr:hypothetical protein [Actinocrispum wychmicini]